MRAAIVQCVRRSFSAFGGSLKTDVKTLALHMDRPSGQLSNEITTTAAAVRGVVETALTEIEVSILTARSDLKAALWTIPLAESSRGGHLRDHLDGEPLLNEWQHFVPAPLTVPAVIQMGVAVQRGVLDNCSIVGAFRYLAAADKQLQQLQRLPSMVAPDPLDPDHYVLVKVAAGEYRLRATLAGTTTPTPPSA